MWDDTIVEEVRQARSRHAERFNFDLRLIFQDLKEQERAGERMLVTFPPRQSLRAQMGKKKRQSQVLSEIQPAG